MAPAELIMMASMRLMRRMVSFHRSSQTASCVVNRLSNSETSSMFIFSIQKSLRQQHQHRQPRHCHPRRRHRMLYLR
jgi:hypothetical protein